MNTKVLTDSPEIVDLKLEFRRLDELTEKLKDAAVALHGSGLRSEAKVLGELENIKQRKAEIARKVAGL